MTSQITYYTPTNPYHNRSDMPNNAYSAFQTPLLHKDDNLPLTQDEIAAKEQKDKTLKLALILPVYYVIKKSTDIFQNACSGDYDKSLSKKMSNFGDRISNSKFAQNKFSTSIKNFFSNITSNFKHYLEQKTVFKTIKETPALPENKMVKGFLKTQTEETAFEFSTTAKEFLDGKNKFNDLKPTKQELEFLKQKYNTNNLSNNLNIKQDLELMRFDKKTLDRLDLLSQNLEKSKPNLLNKLSTLSAKLESTTSVSEKEKLIKQIIRLKEKLDGTQLNRVRANVLKRVKLNALSSGGVKANVLLAEPEKHITEIIDVCKKHGKNAYGKNHNLSLYGNKLRSMTEPLSPLGRGIPKAIYTAMRGLVFTGGVFAILVFVAPTIAQSIVDTKNAKKGKKTATFANGLMNAISWVVSIPVAIKTMFGIGGLKYLGMNKQQVSTYRQELKKFNDKSVKHLFSDKQTYSLELEKLNKLKETPKLGFFKNIFKKLANIIMVGHETPRPYLEAEKSAKNVLRKIPYITKEALAYPVRFGLYMAVLAPIVDKILSGCCHLVFGKPDLPAEATESKQAIPDLSAQVSQSQADKLDYKLLRQDNLLRQAIEGQISNNLTEDTYSYIPTEINTVVPVQINSEDFVPDKSKVIGTFD